MCIHLSSIYIYTYNIICLPRNYRCIARFREYTIYIDRIVHNNSTCGGTSYIHIILNDVTDDITNTDDQGNFTYYTDPTHYSIYIQIKYQPSVLTINANEIEVNGYGLVESQTELRQQIEDVDTKADNNEANIAMIQNQIEKV